MHTFEGFIVEYGALKLTHNKNIFYVYNVRIFVVIDVYIYYSLKQINKIMKCITVIKLKGELINLRENRLNINGKIKEILREIKAINKYKVSKKQMNNLKKARDINRKLNTYLK